MTKGEEHKIAQCLDAFEKVNEGLTSALRECVSIIDHHFSNIQLKYQ